MPVCAKLRMSSIICGCLLYTSDAADERSSVDLGGRRIIKKKKNVKSGQVRSGKTQNTEEGDRW